MGKVERNGHPGYAVRGKPIIGQPKVRSKVDIARTEFLSDFTDPPFEGSAIDVDAEVTHSDV